ncbi:hypothetical protein TcCL_Unassigned00228 [Trypanosoma cruzi]|nr:hypothetical protein TcCL_Unassigned00228 [Trypanosoma cruzi]
MWRTLRSNRRPQKRPYTPHVVCAPTPMSNPSIRRRGNVHHRRTESSSAETLPPRGVFGPSSSSCCNICVIGHSTSTNGTAPVQGAGASHSTFSQQIMSDGITARQHQL